LSPKFQGAVKIPKNTVTSDLPPLPLIKLAPKDTAVLSAFMAIALFYNLSGYLLLCNRLPQHLAAQSSKHLSHSFSGLVIWAWLSLLSCLDLLQGYQGLGEA